MSTSNGSASNPSLDAGHPETSGSENQQSLHRLLEDELLALRSTLGVAHVAVLESVSLGHGEAPGAREFFYLGDGSRRLDCLDWLDVECLVRRSVRNVCELAEGLIGDTEYFGDLLTLQEAAEGWLRGIRPIGVEIDRETQVALAQMLRLLLREVERLALALPSLMSIGNKPAREVLN